MALHHYLIALGSNQRHVRFGRPRDVLRSALEMIAMSGCLVEAVSPFITSRPIGPSQREYANGTAVIRSALAPQAMLAMLQDVELRHGRERRGRRWQARTLDLDIILWSGGIVADAQLSIPHKHFCERAFVLGPASAIARRWRDPLTGLTLGQLHARLTKPAIGAPGKLGARAFASHGRLTSPKPMPR